MVAISAYRGHRHKLPPKPPPRRWLFPKHTISLNDFRRLLRRRAKALSPLPPTNPNFDAIALPQHKQQPAVLDDLQVAGKRNSVAKDQRKEIEEQLLILSEKKHSLVQALKQESFPLELQFPCAMVLTTMVLIAEEELKRRSHKQDNHPRLPLQVDVSSNFRSIMRHSTPRAAGLHAKFSVDKDGQEGDDALNHSQRSFQLLGMDSVPPSAHSSLKRFPNYLPNQ